MASLTSLANELIVTIGEFCPVPDLARLARTQRRFNNLLSSRIYERNLRDEPYRESCLLYASAHKRVDILEIALAHGADMNGRPVPPRVVRSTRPIPDSGSLMRMIKYNCEYVAPRPLHVAVWNGDLEMVQFLLNNGAVHDAIWIPCEDDYNPEKQRLPSFLERETIIKRPLPPSGIQADLTLDLMVREVNSVAPIYITDQTLRSVCCKLRMDCPRMIREIYPLLFALSLPEENNIASLLVRNGARVASLRRYKPFFHAIRVGNSRLFDELLPLYPATETHRDSVRYIAFCMLRDEPTGVPMDMMRHAFIRLWDPNQPEFREQHPYGGWEEYLTFFSIITGRFKEALSVVEMASSAFCNSRGKGLAGELLRHVWWHGDEESCDESAPRVPDDNPLATKLELTKALLQRGAMASEKVQPSYASELHVSPLYLAATDSAGCPHRSAAIRLMLEAGHKQNDIASCSPTQSLSLLQYFLREAAKARHLSKFRSNIILCLDFGARLQDKDYERQSGWSGSLEFSIMAWQEPDGRHPLFDFVLEQAAPCNVDVKYIKFLLRKDFVRDNPRLRNALFKFAEDVLGETVTAVGPPPAPVILD